MHPHSQVGEEGRGGAGPHPGDGHHQRPRQGVGSHNSEVCVSVCLVCLVSLVCRVCLLCACLCARSSVCLGLSCCRLHARMMRCVATAVAAAELSSLNLLGGAEPRLLQTFSDDFLR